jgi:flagellar protein FlaG
MRSRPLSTNEEDSDMKTTPTAEVITAQFQAGDRLNRKGAVPRQDGKQPATTAASPAPASADVRDVKQAVREINQGLRSLNNHLQFSIDDKTESVVVKLIDGDTGEVLRQIPPEEVLRLRAYYKEQQGLLVNTAV